jgi:DNA helicase-2/ATP-dependent DNA helicase PcrA
MALSTQMLLIKTGLQTASEYQIDIFRHFEAAIEAYTSKSLVSNGVVEAVAGSGKTTTIVGAATLLPASLKAIFLAFNKDIATELGARLPNHVPAKTLNSLGWGICKRYADGVAGYKISFDSFNDSNKVWKIIRNHCSKADTSNFGKDIKWLVSMAKSYGVVPAALEGNGYESANGLRDEDSTWDSICSHFGRTIDVAYRPTVYRLFREVLTLSLEDELVYDFDDQKYFPVVRRTENGSRLPCFQYDAIIIDEVQDVSPVDLELVKLVAKKGAIFLGVGDSRQAIYGFRGADTQSIAKFTAATNATVLPLSISYRCATSIVEAARAVYPVIEAAAGAPEGEVTELGNYSHEAFSARNEDMIICRNNAPIVSQAYKLIRRRVPVFVKGRDIGKGILTLIESLKSETVRGLNSDLNIWFAQQTQILQENDPDNDDAQQRLEDRFATLMVFIGENSDNSIASLIDDVETVLCVRGNDKSDASAMKGKVVLSTIHKAKGLEADTVFILDEHLLYKMSGEAGSWTHTQEQNLEYVAITRAKNRLVYISSEGFKD